MAQGLHRYVRTIPTLCKYFATEYLYDEGMRKHGVWRRYYEDGEIMDEMAYKHGKAVGKQFSCWFNNLKAGEHKHWYCNGQLHESTHYKDGLQCGPVVRY
jgi:antitoxin component YwqK of YwqJK toxin-antitoxin module